MKPGMRRSGIEAIGDLPGGTHFALFYKTKQDLIDVLVPYFEAGLKNGEFCLWVTAAPLDAGEARNCMAESIADFDMYAERGQIEIIPYSEWYESAGVFDPGRVLNGCAEKLRKVQELGFSGIRLTGNESWLEQGIWPGFMDYEQRVNATISQFDILVMCTYPVDKCDADDILDVAGSHQFVLTRRNGNWKIIEDQREKKARNALRESEEKFRAIFDRAAIGLAITDSKGYIIDSNPAYQEMLGYSKEELFEKHFAELTHPADVDRNMELQRQLTDGSIEKYQLEKRYIRKDGQSIWCRLTASAIRNPDGSLKNNMAVAEDITERKRAEEMLRDSEEKFRSVADSANTGILLIQGEDIVYINQALAGMGGYTVDECKDLKYWDLMPPDRREYIRWAGNARQQGWVGPSRSELKLIRKNGDEMWLDCYWSVPMLGGKPAVLVMCVDITARKRAESDVLKAKAQAELYLDLMGHDINNLNQIAQGFLEMAIDTLDLTPAQKDLIEKPLGALQSSSRIISNVRKLQKAERGEFPAKTVDVCTVLDDLGARYSNVPDRNVTINFEYHHPCYVPVNELIGDIFSNILGNAIKHSDPLKPLIINMGIENVTWGNKDYFRIMIEDNGPGISDELKETLFSRFKRGETRASGKGLGLYIARTLVQSFQGKLWVEDRVHGDHTSGTRFVVLLPVAKI